MPPGLPEPTDRPQRATARPRGKIPHTESQPAGATGRRGTCTLRVLKRRTLEPPGRGDEQFSTWRREPASRWQRGPPPRICGSRWSPSAITAVAKGLEFFRYLDHHLRHGASCTERVLTTLRWRGSAPCSRFTPAAQDGIQTPLVWVAVESPELTVDHQLKVYSHEDKDDRTAACAPRRSRRGVRQAGKRLKRR